MNDPITNCPGLIVVTSPPTSSTTPTYSWPIGTGHWPSSRPRYGQRSDPQMQVAERRTMASVGSTTRGSRRSSTRTSPGPYITVARIPSALPGRRRRVLLVGHVRAPGRRLPLIVHLLQGEVGHEPVRCGSVPVVLLRLEEHPVPGPDHLHRAAPPLGQADALGDEDGLAVRVPVPGGPGARGEVDQARHQARPTLGDGHGVDEHQAGEPLGGASPRRDAISDHLHGSPPASTSRSPRRGGRAAPTAVI